MTTTSDTLDEKSCLSDIRDLVTVVLEVHANQISTHYPDCWKYHVACLAHAIEGLLGKVPA